MDANLLISKIEEWGRRHKLNNPDRQTIKLMEESGELAHEISRGKYDSKDIKDAIGDIGVVLIILADILKLDFTDCLELAYNEIKDRTGHTKDGSFVKNESDS